MKKTTRLLSLLLVLILCLSVLPMGAAAAGTSGWQTDSDGNWYYYVNGSPATGWKQISGTWYYFVPEYDGMMLIGWLNTDPTFFKEDGSANGDWYHFGSSGAMDASKWIQETYQDEDGNPYTVWYYQLSSGKGAMGWQKTGGVWYYFDPDDAGAMLAGDKYYIDGAWYYFKDSGALYTGWKEFDFGWSYFTSNGAVESGWKKIGGAWYYFDSYTMVTGWQKIGGSWYYFKDSGAMATGWQKIGGSWYYFNASGGMHTGWLKYGGSWYYLKSSGVMAASETVNGYRFDSNGVWISSSSSGSGSSSVSSNTTVYVSNSGKIHLRSNCSGMKNYTTMTYGQAKAKGYTECKDCF